MIRSLCPFSFLLSAKEPVVAVASISKISAFGELD
jgi:hypothetical protein